MKASELHHPADQVFPDPQTFIRTQLDCLPAPGRPDIKLWQAGPHSRLSQLYTDVAADGPAPFWAYVWGGGVALARYLDVSPEIVKGKRVLDLGTGSGLVAISAAKAGASSVVACDIDPYAVAAVRENTSENGVKIEVLCEDLLDHPPPDVDLILVGDLFYEPTTANRLRAYLARCKSEGIDILVGDPGRHHLPTDELELILRMEGYDFANVDGELSQLSVYRLK